MSSIYDAIEKSGRLKSCLSEFKYLTELKGLQEGLTCIQNKYFYQDQYQYFIRK